ncbi:hypothetical protein AB0N09_22185 [Streptomyces erythrochromogenes]|uniref:hypothetical protein n=1 Tax=Streptomyces erythrochromogenes TaxID=285574 RepID=UPI00344A72D3
MDDVQVLALFHTLDRLPGPDHLEFPDGFDHASAASRATRLSDRLGEDVGQPCDLAEAQDAGYCFSIGVPGEATEAGVPLGVRLSNYGCLAVVTTPAPDSHDDLAHAVRDGALSGADRSRIEAALSDLGYTLVPQRLLHQRYDGVTRLTDEDTFIAYPAHQDRATWWTRFFEHL